MKIIITTGFLGAALLLSGCSTTKSGNESVTVESCSHVQITNVSVVRDNGTIETSGTLRPRTGMIRSTGHVDVALIAEDGSVIKQVVAMPSAETFSRNSPSRPVFAVSTEVPGGQPASVRLTHHDAACSSCDL